MSLRFAHAMIQVRDLETCISFYRRVLHLELTDRHDYDGASLAYLKAEAGGCEVELLSERPWRFRRQPEKGRSHLAFTVSDVDAENARIMALGIPCGKVEAYEANGKLQTRFFYLSDPEGNQIEILEATGRYIA